MSAQVVFDCDDLKKEIFSFCLPQYPVITKKMIDDRLAESKLVTYFIQNNLKKHNLLEVDCVDKYLQDIVNKYPVIAIHSLLQELKYEAWYIRNLDGCLLFPSEMECVVTKLMNGEDLIDLRERLAA